MELILVDNGSQDESIAKFTNWIQKENGSKQFSQDISTSKKHLICFEELSYNDEKSQLETLNKYNPQNHDKTMKLIKIKNNCGFTGGNNIALEYVLNRKRTDYILMMNNDTIVEPSFLDDLLSVSEKHPEIGVFGPTIYYYSDPHKIQSAGVEIKWKKGKQIIYHENEMDAKLTSTPIKVDYVTGCALLARIEVFQKIGLFKQNYFAYWEDAEWCIRAKKAGYPVIFVPKAKLWHKQSFTSKKMIGLAEYHFSRNRLWFMREHASPEELIIFLSYFFFYEIFRLLAFLIIRKRDLRMIPYYFKGIWDGIFTHYEK